MLSGLCRSLVDGFLSDGKAKGQDSRVKFSKTQRRRLPISRAFPKEPSVSAPKIHHLADLAE